ncbi:HERV-H LTR-associating protein 1-like [Scleropages formosus]|uniref:HERV-H LTR-associating protein 1-like n=1 Tax=Scleropages formosus TaxID=113540 RepID=A0A0P7V002_SCLFO|nr:HERV-H LTR-associating protein 1-like [Scleropages formosus]
MELCEPKLKGLLSDTVQYECSQQLFSLLSVTSHSSLALHKLTILVYNNFTAILLDVMGNSTSYLHEIFKSSSILSDRELLPLWETESAKPLFNQTITASVHREWYRLPTSSSTSWLPKPSVVETTRVPPTSGSNPADSTTSRPSTTERGTVGSSSTASRTVSLAASAESILKDAGCPWKRLVFAGTGAEIARPTAATATGALSTTISEPKLQPCVLELCKFFSQCLCRGYAKAGTVR